MAKAGFILHGARGKVGNVVARKGENGTVLAEYNPKVKNPQTNLQMAQRIILATVAQAVPQLYPIIDHSFEGFAVGAKCTREFRRLNMGLLRQYAAVDFADAPQAVDASCFMTTKGVKALIPNRYQISSGSLSPSKVKIVRQASPSTGLNIVFPNATIKATVTDGNASFTLGAALQALFGITSPGEQFTLVAIQKAGAGYKYVFNGDDTMPGWVIPYTSMRAARLVIGANVDFNSVITLDVSDPTSVAYGNLINAIEDAFLASPRTDSSLLAALMSYLNAEDYSITLTNDDLVFDFSDAPFEVDDWTSDDNGLGHAYAAGIIRSKLQDNGKWAYSNSFMEIARLSEATAANYGLDWNSAIQAWFQRSEIAENTLFLKEGATTNELGESFT